MKKQYAAGIDSGSSCEKMIVTGPEQEALRQDLGPKVDTVIFDSGEKRIYRGAGTAGYAGYNAFRGMGTAGSEYPFRRSDPPQLYQE